MILSLVMGIVVGIDPGSVITGYGVVNDGEHDLECISYGVIEGRSRTSLSQRLLCIGEGLRQVFETHKPHAVALEKTFFAKNADSALKLGQARGVCLYEAARAQIPIFEYNPTEIKMSLVGYGQAGKDQVKLLVAHLLKINTSLMNKFDMSDALALAIHHLRLQTTKEKMRTRELNPQGTL